MVLGVSATDGALDSLASPVHAPVWFVFTAIVWAIQVPRYLPVILTAQVHLSHI